MTRDAIIKLRWEAGETAGFIAQVLGMTRSAVSGIISRRGWKRSASATEATQKLNGRLPYPQRPAKIARRGEKPVSKYAKPIRRTPEPLAHIPEGNVALLDLTLFSCRWIEGQPSEGFCGRQALRAFGYCCDHEARAFAPSKVRAA